MTHFIASFWRALRDRIAARRAARATLRAAIPPRTDSARVLQSWLDGSRDDVRREQGELVREREEVTHQRAEVARERAENDRLRGEIERLRVDNRALLNSLLGTCGIPPLPLLNGEAPRGGAEAPALRRPSWPQIAAKREIEAARQVRKRQDESHFSPDRPETQRDSSLRSE